MSVFAAQLDGHAEFSALGRSEQGGCPLPPLALLACDQLAELVEAEQELEAALRGFEAGCGRAGQRSYRLTCSAHDRVRRLLRELLCAGAGP